MARGPSRRSGGSRSGGSRSSRSYRSSTRTYRSYGPSYSYGRRRVYRSGRSSLASFFAFVLFFMIMATMSLWSDYEFNKNEFDYMVKDSATYYDMVQNADTSPLYKKTNASVRDVYRYYWEEKGEYYYQIEYSYKNEFTNTYKYGNLTYYMYTKAQIVDMGCASFISSYYGDTDATIEIVYSVDDQINMDYNLYCADYYMYEEEYKSSLGGMFITGGIGVVLLIVIIKLLKKDKEKNAKTVEETTTTYSTTYSSDSQNETNTNTEFPDFNTMFNGMFNNNTTTEKERFCEYCGSKIGNDDIRCPSCGANVRK
ncbi:MAG: zinc ribbon domain-containing protein [Clostridia bacterium]|nr:zinc ribbon domain-containing protein [Clostridia bacterium]